MQYLPDFLLFTYLIGQASTPLQEKRKTNFAKKTSELAFFNKIYIFFCQMWKVKPLEPKGMGLCANKYLMWNDSTLGLLEFECTGSNAFTGWPKSKVATSNGCNSESMHFWPMLVKPKTRLRGGSFFLIFKNLVTIQLFVYNFSKRKMPPFKPILALLT